MNIEELERLVYEYGNDVYKFCYYVTSDRDLADELYQETFLKAVQLRSKIDNGSNPKSYLMGIAVNIWKNYKRKKTGRNKILPQIDYEENKDKFKSVKNDVLDEYVKKELFAELNKSIELLPEKQKLVVVLYYADRLSTEEIGHILHIPKGTVMSRLAKARENLKKEMEARGYEV